jgi:L-asparaginase/Glu-tRNA(Gln) amidotransferase subunit D
VPELKKVANVRGEQVYQIASESITNDHWLTLSTTAWFPVGIRRG